MRNYTPQMDAAKRGIIASRIAAHAADIAKNIPHARDLDDRIADARRTFDWEKQWECAIDPETAKAIRDSRAPEHQDSCSMCGKFFAVRSMNKALTGEYIEILETAQKQDWFSNPVFFITRLFALLNYREKE